MQTISLGDPYTLVIKQGRAKTVIFPVLDADNQPCDLTGYSVAAQIRQWRDDKAPLLATFTATIPIPTSGEVLLVLDENQTRAIKRNGAYDVKLTTPEGDPIDLVEGDVIIRSEVTP